MIDIGTKDYFNQDLLVGSLLMRSNKKSSVLVLLILCLSLSLTACGGLTAESAKERLLTAEDFDFEVQVDSSPSKPEMSSFFEGKCSELDKAVSEYSKSTLIAGSEFDERINSQNRFFVNQYVIQFPSKDEALSFVDSVEKVAKNPSCEWFFTRTVTGVSGSAYGIGSEEIGNIRDLQSAFKVKAEKSVVLDIDTSMLISGAFLSDKSLDEGGAAFAASGDLVVIVHYQVRTDEITEFSQPVTQGDIEKVLSIAFKRMLG